MQNIAREKKEDENSKAGEANPQLSLNLEVQGVERFEEKTQAVLEVVPDSLSFFLVQDHGWIRESR